MLKTAIGRLRVIGFVEGMSYLLLLFIAMPVKYFLNEPLAVMLVGALHGLLFVLFIFAVIHAAFVHRWSFTLITGAVIASLVPFGTFVLDAKIKNM
ncbi:DUF3817 domain-containing protein [Brevibacillus daliensis]|uniref:DUF3817 domain-containing protein n=1 Tax=Brevibacillus daliensis TaxID=2892995 RepID=UPI001E56DFF6|nr:DUF3817 domain-containing protein [Brevibacillus daliensis]